jgi:hypothetical protein
MLVPPAECRTEEELERMSKLMLVSELVSVLVFDLSSESDSE